MLAIADLTDDQLSDALRLDPAGVPRRPVLTLDADTWMHASTEEVQQTAERLAASRAIIVAVSCHQPVSAPLTRAADVTIGVPGSAAHLPGARILEVPDPLAAATSLQARVHDSPVAALTLTWLLRGSVRLDIPTALAAESAAYSALLGGHRFAQWLRARPAPRPPDGPERVTLRRDGDVLHVRLNRPSRRNAVDTAMRSALLEAFAVAVADDHLSVQLDAAGPSFSAGGDLNEFGTATDLAAAHIVRVAASVGQVITDLGDRVHVRVHGACIGAGVEVPAFAHTVTAASDAYFALPEVAMGLIPGAGGTVSIPRRIGRIRATWLALSGEAIDATTALGWGLVDAVH